MSFEIGFVLFLLAGALVLFALEVLPIEVTALSVLGALLVSGLVTPQQAIEGFSNKAVLTIGCLFVLSHALTKTGLVAAAADRLADWAGPRHWLGIGALLACVGVLSGFLNNTAVVAIFIPLVLDLSGRLGVSPSRILIPLSYASIMGGTLTLIGTSTNLLVSSIAQTAGQEPLGMFEFSRLGGIFLLLGLTYVLLFARRLLPERVEAGDLTSSYELGAYLTEVEIAAGSSLIGTTCRRAELGKEYDLNVLSVIRGKRRYVESVGTLPLAEGDVLMVQATVEDLMRLRGDHGVALLPEVKLTEEELSVGGLVTAEVLVAPNSSVIGSTVAQADLRRRFGGFVMAIRRQAQTMRTKVGNTVLRAWDALLTLIPSDRVDELRRSQDFIVLSELPVALRRQRFWWAVLVVLPAAVLLSAFGVLEITGGVLVGVIALMVLGVVTPREAYGSVHWSVIVLIAAFVPVGRAAIESGTADYLAAALVWLAGLLPLPPAHAVLCLLYLATSLLTQVVSNAAAAIILTPIAISLGAGLGVDPRPFLMAVCFAASAEFMTPVGYQTNLMVYAPGGYRFLDYTRFGAPLNLLFWATATLLIPVFWPF